MADHPRAGPATRAAAAVAGLRRRTLLLGAAAGAAAAPASAQWLSPPTGWLRTPLPLPALPLQLTDGTQRSLAEVLTGQRSAVQLMFSGCTASCPTQGAEFAALSRRLPGSGVQLLSISIDALGDTPQTLARWQARFGAHPRWLAGVPPVADVDRLADLLRGSRGHAGTHTSQVFLVDRLARLVWRSADAPALAEVLGLLSAPEPAA